MQLLFVDESGTPPAPNKAKHKYFVIGGLIVPEGHWHRLKDNLQGLKTRTGIRGEIKWRYFAPGNHDDANPMKHLDRLTRDSLRTEIYSKVICSDKSIKALACVACVNAAYKFPSVIDAASLYQATYKPVSERFQYHLQDLSRDIGRDEFGIVVSDHRGIKDDKRFRTHHEKLLHSGGCFTSTYDNIVESLFLQPSNLSIGIQMADMVAGAVWRAYEANDWRWFELLRPSFRCSKIGNIEGFGVVKYPKANWE